MNGQKKGKASSSSVKTKKFKFNFVDVALICVIISIVIAVIYFLPSTSWLKDKGRTQDRKIQYTIEILDVDKDFFDNILAGEIVIDSVTKANIGNVFSINNNEKYTEYEYIEQKDTEKLTPIEYGDRFNLQITIEATAKYVTDEGYNVNGTRIAVGEKMYVRFPNFIGEGYCIGIDDTLN